MTRPWEGVRELIDAGDFDGLATVISGLEPDARAALLPPLDGYQPERPAPEPVVLPPLEPEPPPELPKSGMVAFAWIGSPDERPPSDLAGWQEYAARQRLRQRERERDRLRTQLERRAAEAATALYQRRRTALSLAHIGSTPAASEVVKRLNRPWGGGTLLLPHPDIVPALLRIRGQAWCATLARGLARRTRTGTRPDLWLFTEALLRATRTEPPATPGVVSQWVAGSVRATTGAPLADRLAADPWLDGLLPQLFDTDRAAAALGDRTARAWPRALAELAGRGRTDRATLIANCLRRLRAGGRQSRLQPFLATLRLLEPGTEQLAEHRQELAGLLTSPMLPVAEFAFTALRALGQSGQLETGTLVEITQSVLSRPEKKLFRAHLGWLDGMLRRSPEDADRLLEGLVTGLHHPTADLAGHALDVIARHLPASPPQARQRLMAELPLLDGTVAHRLAELLGTVREEPPPSAPPALEPPAGLPQPLDLGALAGELASLFATWPDDPVQQELILDGLVRAGRSDRKAAARVLVPLMPAWPNPWSDMIAALTGSPAPRPYPQPYPSPPRRPHPLQAFIERRLAGVAECLTRTPPPGLLATPATVAGHVDPQRVLDLLHHAERDGWQPGEADLTQALLRLPRHVDPAIRAAATRLTSPAGRRFAGWLADTERSEPRTWIEEIGAPAGPRPHWERSRPDRRLAMVEPAGLPAGLADPRGSFERAYHTWSIPRMGLWPMIAPSHREVIAAHIQPFLASAADEDRNVPTDCLAGLALTDGPCGPAMSLTLAYTLAARRESARLAAADALIALAARPDWDSTTLGAELGLLTSTGRVVLRRTLSPLTDVLKAGAHHAVWQIAVAALEPLLAAGPRPGLPELINLASDAARAGRHTDRVPGLAALANAPGHSQLVLAARELASTIRQDSGLPPVTPRVSPLT